MVDFESLEVRLKKYSINNGCPEKEGSLIYYCKKYHLRDPSCKKTCYYAKKLELKKQEKSFINSFIMYHFFETPREGFEPPHPEGNRLSFKKKLKAGALS